MVHTMLNWCSTTDLKLRDLRIAVAQIVVHILDCYFEMNVHNNVKTSKCSLKENQLFKGDL